MFSKTGSNPPLPANPANRGQAPSATPASTTPVTQTASSAPEPARAPAPRPPKGSSIIGGDMLLEGDISGGGEIQVEGTIKGDVRVEHVTVGDGGMVEGGIYAEAVEVRGKVSGSITAKQVRLYGACQVEGDITHEQLAMETARVSSRAAACVCRRQAAPAAVDHAASPKPEPTLASREFGQRFSAQAICASRPGLRRSRSVRVSRRARSLKRIRHAPSAPKWRPARTVRTARPREASRTGQADAGGQTEQVGHDPWPGRPAALPIWRTLLMPADASSRSASPPVAAGDDAPAGADPGVGDRTQPPSPSPRRRDRREALSQPHHQRQRGERADDARGARGE